MSEGTEGKGEGKGLAGGKCLLTSFSGYIQILPSRADLNQPAPAYRSSALFTVNKKHLRCYEQLSPYPCQGTLKQELRKQDYKDLVGNDLRRKNFLLGWRLLLGWHKAPEQTAAYQKLADRYQWLLLAILVVFSKHKIMHKNKFLPGFSSELPLPKITYFSPPTIYDRWLIFTEYFTT